MQLVLLLFLLAFVHDRLPSFEILLFELYKVFEISRQEGATGFRVVEHGRAIFAEEYAVNNIVEGEIEESVFKMTGVLLEKDSLS
jgi:hypothetical protein